MDDGTGTYSLHDSSLITHIDSIATNERVLPASTNTQTVVLTAYTTDLSLDLDGT